jgi:hypothetical protein
MSSIFAMLGTPSCTSKTLRSYAFHDDISDIKTVEEIAMKKPKMVTDLLAVTDVCIKASEAQTRLLESRSMGPSRKKDDREVNTTDRGDQKDRGDRGTQSSY